jgi:hypothetical protein
LAATAIGTQRFDAELLSTKSALADVLDGLGRTREAAELRRQLDKTHRPSSLGRLSNILTSRFRK